jgi:hypothetical protein
MIPFSRFGFNFNLRHYISAAKSMFASRAALGQHGLNLAASATLNATMSYRDASLDFAWNLTVMMVGRRMVEIRNESASGFSA